MRAGEVVLSRGTVLNAPRLGVLATVGRARVVVVPRPKVAVVSTGDELIEPDQVPGPGQIRNSNATVLRALAARHGADVEVMPIAPDEPGALREIIGRGLAADVLLITGGVSAGNRDLVPEALEAPGGRAGLPQGPAQAGQTALVRGRPGSGRRRPGPWSSDCRGTP